VCSAASRTHFQFSLSGNPPGHIAQLFKEVITQEFNGCYKHITFAIYGTKRSSGIHVATRLNGGPSLTPIANATDDHNARNKHNPEGNLLPFQKVFGPPQPLPRGRKSHGMYSGTSLDLVSRSYTLLLGVQLTLNPATGDDADDENSTDTCTGSERYVRFSCCVLRVRWSVCARVGANRHTPATRIQGVCTRT
jgi:hypothetical protein